MASPHDAEWADPANWYGPFYYGRTDTRPLVPRRTGLGVTLNVAHPLGLGAGVLALVVALVLLAMGIFSLIR